MTDDRDVSARTVRDFVDYAARLLCRSVEEPARRARRRHEVPVTPPEDLMREHGVLKRVLLIYREGLDACSLTTRFYRRR